MGRRASHGSRYWSQGADGPALAADTASPLSPFRQRRVGSCFGRPPYSQGERGRVPKFRSGSVRDNEVCPAGTLECQPTSVWTRAVTLVRVDDLDRGLSALGVGLPRMPIGTAAGGRSPGLPLITAVFMRCWRYQTAGPRTSRARRGSRRFLLALRCLIHRRTGSGRRCRR